MLQDPSYLSSLVEAWRWGREGWQGRWGYFVAILWCSSIEGLFLQELKEKTKSGYSRRDKVNTLNCCSGCLQPASWLVSAPALYIIQYCEYYPQKDPTHKTRAKTSKSAKAMRQSAADPGIWKHPRRGSHGLSGWVGALSKCLRWEPFSLNALMSFCSVMRW